MKEGLCPCYSNLPYAECCAPYHQGSLPLTPVKLMRSRYAAYALDLADYLIATTHPENPRYTPHFSQWKQEIHEFSKKTVFAGLIILAEDANHVTFKAILKQNNQDVSFTEKSLFKKVKGAWLYHSGQY